MGNDGVELFNSYLRFQGLFILPYFGFEVIHKLRDLKGGYFCPGSKKLGFETVNDFFCDFLILKTILYKSNLTKPYGTQNLHISALLFL